MESRQIIPSNPAHRPPKPQRILSCVLCQQRKVKCDRKFPCNHCVKGRVECVPAHQMPRRKRRPDEQGLKQKLRKYEQLLRKNNIAFEPTDGIHTESTVVERGGREQSKGKPHLGNATEPVGEASAATKDVKNEEQALGKVKNFWNVMHQRPSDTQDITEKADTENDFGNTTFDDLSEPAIVKVWGRVYENDHDHLFGDSKSDVPLSTLHPSQFHIFRLWQIYSDNINPLLKVTHGPTLQARILDAAADVAEISCELEALMFGIYCTALITISDEECLTAFGEPKTKLLRRYRNACHQALVKCGFLRSRERDCLTAFFLYLVSLRPDTNPHTLSPLFAIAFRIAYRMNIANEATNTKHGVFEAEMRRRLWWAMVIYDSRISELTDYKTTQLIPTWDCNIPANVNDFDLRPEMTRKPTDQSESTEALFVVVRSAIGNFIRHSALHLDFINPMLKNVVKSIQHDFDPYDENLSGIEKFIENQHLKHCDPENPLHYITIWWARNYLAKYRFFIHCSRHSQSPSRQTIAECDSILSYALCMLECDTALMASPLTRGYRWLIQFHFPFPAYVRIVQDLRLRPVGQHADRAWEILNTNYCVRFACTETSINILFKMFGSNVLQAWAARTTALFGQENIEETWGMITDIQQKLGRSPPLVSTANDAARPIQGHLGLRSPSEIQVPGMNSQEFTDDFRDPSFTEFSTDLFEMDWGGVDWFTMSGPGWT